MILYRHLPTNLPHSMMEWLEGATHHYLRPLDPSFEWGVVGTTIMPVNYTTLPIPELDQRGFQLMLTFWGWGDSEAEVMENLGRTFTNVQAALVNVSREIIQSTSAN